MKYSQYSSFEFERKRERKKEIKRERSTTALVNNETIDKATPVSSYLLSQSYTP